MILGGGLWEANGGGGLVLLAAPRVPGGNVDIIRQFIHRVPAVVVLPALVPSVAVQMLQNFFVAVLPNFCNIKKAHIWAAGHKKRLARYILAFLCYCIIILSL